MRLASVLFFTLALATTACFGKIDESSEPGPPPSERTDTAISGVIAGKPFTAKAVQLHRYLGKWIVSFHGYDAECGTSSTPPDEMILAYVQMLEGGAGTLDVALGDGHNAAFQLGTAVGNIDVRAVRRGTLSLDTWSETRGDEVTGSVVLEGADGKIQGRFTAKVCAT